MNNDFYGSVESEQPFRLNVLQPLIHHRCRINRYFCPHCPVGMIERFLDSDVCHLLFCKSAEWSTGTCKNNFFNVFLFFSVKRLKNSTVFTINRDKINLVFRFTEYQFPGNHQGFLIGKSKVLIRLNSGQGRYQAGTTDDSRDHQRCIGVSCNFNGTLFTTKNFYIFPLK